MSMLFLSPDRKNGIHLDHLDNELKEIEQKNPKLAQKYENGVQFVLEILRLITKITDGQDTAVDPWDLIELTSKTNEDNSPAETASLVSLAINYLLSWYIIDLDARRHVFFPQGIDPDEIIAANQ